MSTRRLFRAAALALSNGRYCHEEVTTSSFLLTTLIILGKRQAVDVSHLAPRKSQTSVSESGAWTSASPQPSPQLDIIC